jgi:hypothetical protein
MNAPHEDEVWKNLLAGSAPSFACSDTPPFGLATRVLAGLQGAELQEALWERVGRRAIFAALGTVVLMALITLARVQSIDEGDASLGGLAHLEDVIAS